MLLQLTLFNSISSHAAVQGSTQQAGHLHDKDLAGLSAEPSASTHHHLPGLAAQGNGGGGTLVM